LAETENPVGTGLTQSFCCRFPMAQMPTMPLTGLTHRLGPENITPPIDSYRLHPWGSWTDNKGTTLPYKVINPSLALDPRDPSKIWVGVRLHARADFSEIIPDLARGSDANATVGKPFNAVASPLTGYDCTYHREIAQVHHGV